LIKDVHLFVVVASKGEEDKKKGGENHD